MMHPVHPELKWRGWMRRRLIATESVISRPQPSPFISSSPSIVPFHNPFSIGNSSQSPMHPPSTTTQMLLNKALSMLLLGWRGGGRGGEGWHNVVVIISVPPAGLLHLLLLRLHSRLQDLPFLWISIILSSFSRHHNRHSLRNHQHYRHH